MPKPLSDLVREANAELNEPGQHLVVGAPEGETPRFELYHANFSICSQKVRAMITEKNIPFTAHQLNLPVSEDHPSDSYRPGYIRLRLRGAPDVQMVSGYTGQSSVADEGFDPCVVPTLVDHQQQRVVVDNVRICNYLDREADLGPRLVPDQLADAIAAQVSLVDAAPHPAVLYGASPKGEDIRPEIVAIPITGSLTHAIRHLENFKAAHADQPDLVAAYDAKIARQSSARDFTYDKEQMVDAYNRMTQHVADLENQLNTHDGEWVMGDAYTLADIMWSASLFRLKWLGLGQIWENSNDKQRVTDYVERAFMRPSFRRAVIDWPMATPPSQHIEPTAPWAQNLFPAWQKMRESMGD
ncbi:MAG: glutathione S-transferase family protein [Pseudomonadota bacterium]